MKRRFFDTNFAKVAGLSSQMTRVLRYVVENKNSLFTTEDLSSLAYSTRNILRTPMAEFFERIVASDQLSNFTAIFAPEKGASIPEALTANSLSLDLGHLPDQSSILNSFPELKNKVLINLTGIIKADRQSGGYAVSAVDTFQNIITRGALTASYHDNDGWLTPYIAEYAAKSYSMILSGIISRYHDLTLPETLQIAGILALYFCQGLARNNEDFIPAVFNRCTWVGSKKELMDLAGRVAEVVEGKQLTIASTAESIGALGPERLRKFSHSDFVAMCGNLGPDLLTGQIALEFPPYWIYVLLLALSGQKVPMVFQLNNQKLQGEGRNRFLPQLVTADGCYTVKRR